MKLLSKTEAQTKIKADNEELIRTNIRLRKFWKDITEKLNNAKDNYEPEKLKALKNFEQFCKDIMARKSKLLEELQSIEKAIEEKKEIYYEMITRQDALDEKVYQMNEQEKKLKLRETFVLDLEQKWRDKT